MSWIQTDGTCNQDNLENPIQNVTKPSNVHFLYRKWKIFKIKKSYQYFLNFTNTFKFINHYEMIQNWHNTNSKKLGKTSTDPHEIFWSSFYDGYGKFSRLSSLVMQVTGRARVLGVSFASRSHVGRGRQHRPWPCFGRQKPRFKPPPEPKTPLLRNHPCIYIWGVKPDFIHNPHKYIRERKEKRSQSFFFAKNVTTSGLISSFAILSNKYVFRCSTMDPNRI